MTKHVRDLLRIPVRENRTQESARGTSGNQRFYLNVPEMEITELSLHELAGYGFIFGIISVAIAALLWRISDGGGYGVGFIVLPRFLGGSIIFSMISAAIWWVTKS
ncbi:MAG: hypothetical protein R3F19_11705 [Verrucomicrobiales bacterium]